VHTISRLNSCNDSLARAPVVVLQDFAKQFGPLISAIAIVLLMGYVVFVPLGSKKSTKKRR